MNYRKVVEEQIGVLKERQNKLSTGCANDELCMLAETIAKLAQIASQLPLMKA